VTVLRERSTLDGVQPNGESSDAVEHLRRILRKALDVEASDVHLKPGAPPALRVDGELQVLDATPLGRELVESATMGLAAGAALDPAFILRKQCDFGCDVDGIGRLRCHAYRTGGRLALSIRMVKSPIPDLGALRLPPVIKRIALAERGLVLVTGPQGTGRTTTIASMLQFVNTQATRHVATLEDPIEFRFDDRQSRFSQREIGRDVDSVVAGLDGAMREDADIVLVGALQTQQEMELALTVAESGRLVVSTMHTVGAPRTVQRISGLFPPQQRDSVRRRLADAVAGMVSQRLVPLRNSRRRVLVTEVLTPSPNVLDCIREERRLKALHAAMETNTTEHGSHTFDQRLLTMAREGLITIDTAQAVANNPAHLVRSLNIVR